MNRMICFYLLICVGGVPTDLEDELTKSDLFFSHARCLGTHFLRSGMVRYSQKMLGDVH